MRYKCVGEVIFCDEWTEQKWQFSKVVARQFPAVCDKNNGKNCQDTMVNGWMYFYAP